MKVGPSGTSWSMAMPDGACAVKNALCSFVKIFRSGIAPPSTSRISAAVLLPFIEPEAT